MLKRFTQIESSVETITPEAAKKYLERNVNNRNVNKDRVAIYARDILAGNWTGGSSIGFFENGDLADGQHRLQAVVSANVPAVFVVIRNLPYESKLNHNGGMVQTAANSIKMYSGQNELYGVRVPQASSFVRTLIEVEVSQSAASMSPSELITKMESVADALSFVAPYVRRKHKGISASAVWAAIIPAVYVVDKAKLATFCEVFTGKRNAIDACESMAMRFATVMVTTNQIGFASRLEVFMKTQRCIKAFMEGQSLTRFYAGDGFVYSAKERLGFKNGQA